VVPSSWCRTHKRLFGLGDLKFTFCYCRNLVTWWGASRNCPTSHHDFIDSQLKVTSMSTVAGRHVTDHSRLFDCWFAYSGRIQYRMRPVIRSERKYQQWRSVITARQFTEECGWLHCPSGWWSLLLLMNWFMPWLMRLVARLSPRDLGFNLRPVGVEFVVDKVLWKHVFPVCIVPPMLYAYPSISDATDRADKQHSARTITGSHLCSTVRMFV